MNVLQSAQIAGRALRVNKLRSGLTMLGIIIGVGAVIAMVSVGAGAQVRLAEQIQSLGSNLIIAMSGSTSTGGIRLGAGTQATITEDDALAIERDVSLVQVASPTSRGTAQIVYGNLNWSTIVQGVTANYLEARDWPVTVGRPIADEDVAGATKVALLGRTTVQNLFGDADPLGQIIRIKKVPFTVIGLLDRKGQSSNGQDQDDVILMPLSTAKQKILGAAPSSYRSVGSIAIKIRPDEDMADAETQIRGLLRQRHRLQPNQEDDFSLRNLSQVVQTQEDATRVMTYLLAAVASVSLLVGGTIGVALGFGSAYAISYLAQWRTVVAPATIALAFGFSAAIGIFFGFYPARKAARLNPIEALRYE